MIEKILLTEEELKSNSSSYLDKTKSLFNHQLQTWELAKQGYESLKSVQIKEFYFDDFVVKVQFNPGRIISSAAKVDEKSIRGRKCFLCYQNLPEQQKAIAFENNYLILVNPFPIFPEHFTIPMLDHLPQSIEENFHSLLNLAKAIGEDYTVFYNGPKCGASAPDHMHFQAGTKNFMPIDYEFESLKNKKCKIIFEDNTLRIFSSTDYLRNFFAIESFSKMKISHAFNALYNSMLKTMKEDETEPMMNIIAKYENDRYTVFIFPRSKHRPDYYFLDNERKIILSPASVDLGGVCITPRQEDFEKITKEIIADIFRQVSVGAEEFEFYSKHLLEEL
ncbi:MAG: DUF4922 domain-containing protein [Ignavibacteriales bacterium]